MGFKTGGWYIEKSLTTIGKKDPVSDYNTQLWNTGIEANREQLENRSVDFIMFLTSMLFQTLKIPIMKVKSSCIVMARKSLKC